MDEPRSAQRYLEDLTPGGSEYFNNPKRCYEWAYGRIESAHRIALDAALERNRLQAEIARLHEQFQIAQDALSRIVDNDDPYQATGRMSGAATIANDALIRMSGCRLVE